MPNTPGNDDRHEGATDREWERDVSSETGRGTTGGGRRSNRGFASMDRSKQREIASKGGKAAHAKGTAHEFDSDEAREAGRKGGQAVSRNRDHMAMIGRRGGEARGHSRTRTPAPPTPSGTGGRAETGTAAQNSRGMVSDREVGLHGAGSGPANGVTASTQGARGASNSSLGGEARNAGPSAAERSSNH
jgi:general stress protein YciG